MFTVECEKLVTTNNGTCPEGFDEECHDYCYKMTHTSASVGSGAVATWVNAQRACTALGARIVTIRGEEEQKCIGNYIASAKSAMWIGLYDVSNQLNTATWQWVDPDYQGTYTNWAPGRNVLLLRFIERMNPFQRDSQLHTQII